MNLLEINRGIHKRLYKYFVYQIRKYHYRYRARVLVKNLNCKPLSKRQVKDIKKYYASFGFKNINTEWHRYFTHISGKFHKEYVPVDFYITVIEPCLNKRNKYPALVDKNLLKMLFTDVKQPETIVRMVNGIFVDEDYNKILDFKNVIEKCKKYSKLIIKPSIESGGGKNIIVFNIKGSKTDYKDKSIEEILSLYDENFIIQNYIEQHDQMNKLNLSSVNTLRIQTLLIHNKVELVVSFVRIGGKDSKVDNITDGGVLSTINPKGILNKIGYNSLGESFLETDGNVALDGFIIPNYIEIIKKVKSLHLKTPYFKLISWDIAIDKIGDPVLIEYNVFSQGIDFQHTTGPLFGRFTNEILSECKVNMFLD